MSEAKKSNGLSRREFLRDACFIAGGVALGATGLLSDCGGGGKAPDTTTLPDAAGLTKQSFVFPDLPRITAQDLYVIYNNKDPLTLVDVRTKELFDGGYIPGARNIPNPTNSNPDSAWDSDGVWDTLIKSTAKDRLICVYCDCPDDNEAGKTAEHLINYRGYKDYNIKILWKGVFYWQELGYPTRQ